MSRRRRSPLEDRIVALIAEIKDVNDAAHFHPDRWEQERLREEKSKLQSELLREYGEHFEIHRDGKGIIGILGATHDWDACHAVIEKLDPDVRAWVKAQLKGR